MRSFYLFEASPHWEETIEHGLLYSYASLAIANSILWDLFSLVEAWRLYGLGSVHLSAGLGFFLVIFLLFIVFSSFYFARLFSETRKRLQSGVIDDESRRTLLNVSNMGYRLYVILLFLPAIIFLTVQYIHP